MKKKKIIYLNSLDNKFKSFNNVNINKVNNRKITYMTNYANKNRNKSSTNNDYNKEYFFEYGNSSN